MPIAELTSCRTSLSRLDSPTVEPDDDGAAGALLGDESVEHGASARHRQAAQVDDEGCVISIRHPAQERELTSTADDASGRALVEQRTFR